MTAEAGRQQGCFKMGKLGRSVLRGRGEEARGWRGEGGSGEGGSGEQVDEQGLRDTKWWWDPGNK